MKRNLFMINDQDNIMLKFSFKMNTPIAKNRPFLTDFQNAIEKDFVRPQYKNVQYKFQR